LRAFNPSGLVARAAKEFVMAEALKDPLDVVRAFLRAMETKDYDSGLRYVADNCEYANPGVLPTVYGPTGVRALLEPFFAPTLENEFVIVRSAVNGAIVFLERLDRHRLADRWVELPVTGVFEVHDGLINVWRDYFDGPTILKAWPS
jgi:limonene-1,2-epoxide hydrolase